MSWQGPDRRAVGVSLAVHVVVVLPLVALTRPPQPVEFETMRIHIVSRAPVEVAEPEPAPPVVTPEPQPPAQRPEPEVQAEEAPPEPEPEEAEPETETPPETPPQAPPSPAPPDEDASEGEGLNIETEGREFPYPDYLNNVVIQVHRYFRWSDEGRPRGVVYFEILEDGSVRNIRMVRPSGNRRFDFAVLGAVETAGTRGAFGPLPEGYAAPTLPVQLEVEPPR